MTNFCLRENINSITDNKLLEANKTAMKQSKPPFCRNANFEYLPIFFLCKWNNGPKPWVCHTIFVLLICTQILHFIDLSLVDRTLCTMVYINVITDTKSLDANKLPWSCPIPHFAEMTLSWTCNFSINLFSLSAPSVTPLRLTDDFSWFYHWPSAGLTHCPQEISK